MTMRPIARRFCRMRRTANTKGPQMSSDARDSDENGAGGSAPSPAQGPGRHAPPPNVKPRRKAGISWIWLVPLVAVLVGLSLLVRGWLSVGPVVTISFESAEGLEVGQTKIRYRDVVVGVVKDISISEDRSTVLVKAQLNRDGA